MALKEKGLTDHWNHFWGKASEVEPWDSMSEVVFRALMSEIGNPRGERIAEIGSGTGRISLRLAQEGASVVMIDTSKEALRITSSLVDESIPNPGIALASMFRIPFCDGTFDCVWNAGVLEHFKRKQQVRALTEMRRVCKPRGLVITLVPHSRSLPYRVGKTWSQVRGTWQFGYEKPVRTMRRQIRQSGMELLAEYSIGPDISFDFLRRLPDAVQRLLKRGFFARMSDSLGTNGYLLTTVARCE